MQGPYSSFVPALTSALSRPRASISSCPCVNIFSLPRAAAYALAGDGVYTPAVRVFVVVIRLEFASIDIAHTAIKPSIELICMVHLRSRAC